jgi:hypothetical protein
MEIFAGMLLEKVKANQAISNNGLLDGFMIGLIYTNAGYISQMIISNTQLPPMSDNGIQQLEQSFTWLINHEQKLVNLFNAYANDKSKLVQ